MAIAHACASCGCVLTEARGVFDYPLAPIGIVVGGIALWVGMCWGRMVARWIVVLFLPPRLRAPFSYLWIADGKPLPRS